MKNLLLLSMLFLIGTAGYSQEGCFLSTAKISEDSTCLFVTFSAGLESIDKPINIRTLGKKYWLNDTVAGTYRYSLYQTDTTILYDCDTIGQTGFVGEIDVTMFNTTATCKFKGGEDLPACPDNVLISQTENCLVFTFLEGYEGNPLPDSVRLNDSTIYYSLGFNSKTPTALIYLQDTTLTCDSSSMSPLPLSDTLFIGKRVCTYQMGILPINILAFKYQSDEDGGISLSWKVNSEEPTRQLYLQKSYDGVVWSNVYEQSLENYTTGQTMDGQYKDMSIDKPQLYYRLFISGYTGEVKYSNILPVTMKNLVISSLFYQPESRSIMIKAGQNYTGEMQLINTQGQNVMTRKIQIMKNTIQEIDVQGYLTPGIYFVKFDNGLIPPSKIFIN